MKLSKSEVKKIAYLARLQLSDQEIDKFQRELSSILEYVDQLQKIDTDKVKATSQVTGLKNIKREDEVDYNFPRQEILDSAIEEEEKHLKVKNIF